MLSLRTLIALRAVFPYTPDMNLAMTVLLLAVCATAAEPRAEFLVMAGGQAESAGWSADGKILATVNHDGTIKLWGESGELLRTLGGHASGTVMAWKPGSHLITSGGDDAAIRFWDADKGVLAGEFAAGHQVQGLAWSSDGGRLASNGEGYFKVWEAKSRKLLRTFGQSGNTEYINGVVWRPGGKEIISVAGTGFVKTWNAETGAVVRSFLIATRSERKHVFLGGFSPDGKKLVTGSDNLILLWDAEANGRAAPLWRVVREHYDIAGLAWSPDGRRILSCDAETHARIWRVEDGKEAPGPGAHKQAVRSVAWRTGWPAVGDCQFRRGGADLEGLGRGCPDTSRADAGSTSVGIEPRRHDRGGVRRRVDPVVGRGRGAAAALSRSRVDHCGAGVESGCGVVGVRRQGQDGQAVAADGGGGAHAGGA